MPYKPAQLKINKVAGGTSVYPKGSATTDDLYIYPNPIDVHPYICLVGDAYALIYGKTIMAAAAGSFLQFDYSTPDAIIENTIDTKNIYLKTTGTGKIKFGTHTGSGDVACNGSIAIIDSGGTARKLMTTA
jgi:hypothetical protein